MSSPSWAAWTSSWETWTADVTREGDRRGDQDTRRPLPVEAVGHHPRALVGAARAGLCDQRVDGGDRADPRPAALAHRGDRILLLHVSHSARGPPRCRDLHQRALHAARRRRDDGLPRAAAGRPGRPDDQGRRHHLAFDDRVPGRLRRRADDAGRSSLRGKPNARADRRHHPAASHRAGAAPRQAGEGGSCRVRRGGAGFPTGNKWSFLPKGVYPRYLVCNADESEPGCFKDRYLIENSPHQVLEGILIASYAIGCNLAFIYIRGEYLPQHEALEAAIEEARQAGYLGKNVLGKGYEIDVILHRGAGAYICGEETALLTSLEGYRGEPRLKPPFPAIKGLYGKPTVVNNVETVANLPHIVINGADWFGAMGTPTGKGTRGWCMSGHVNRPGNYELEDGTPIRELIEEHGGGVWKNRKLKAFQPGGASMMVLLPEHLDVGLDFDAIQKAGSLAGAGAMVVMDETTCMVDAARRYVKFF